MSKDKTGVIYVRKDKKHGNEIKDRAEEMAKDDKVGLSHFIRWLINKEYRERSKKEKPK